MSMMRIGSLTRLGDMLRPKCSLCSRTDKTCNFPDTSRKSSRNSTNQRKSRPNTKGKQLGWCFRYDRFPGSNPVEADSKIDRLLALLESRVDQNHFGDSISSFDLSATMQPDLMPPPSVSRVDSPPNYHLDHDLGSINAQQGGTSVMITDHSFWNSIMSPGQPVAHPDQFLDNAHFSNDGVPGNLSDLSMELDMPHAGSSMSSQDESLTALQSSLLPANSPASSIPETNIPYDDL